MASKQNFNDLLNQIKQGNLTKEQLEQLQDTLAKTKTDENKDGKTTVYNLIIVDESGSMSHLREVTLSGINETINVIKTSQEEYADSQTHYLSIVTFDSDNQVNLRNHYKEEPIANVKEFRDYSPNGCTPLFDAMGISISSLYNKIKDDGDATAVVTILTDGMENSSTEWTAAKLRNLINQLKGRGWTFSYMGSAHDVKDVADLLSIDNFMEFSHDIMGASNTWGREMSSKRCFLGKISRLKGMTSLEKNAGLCSFANEYYSDRVTPKIIETLSPDEVFVFGSSVDGNHNGGVAGMAVRRFGAVMGQSEGIQGQSYAIPTTGGLELLVDAVNRFTDYAKAHPEKRFLVTRIGCGRAGHSAAEIAPLFKGCIKLENVSLPRDFWKYNGLTIDGWF